jgi:hypothetical protein
MGAGGREVDEAMRNEGGKREAGRGGRERGDEGGREETREGERQERGREREKREGGEPLPEPGPLRGGNRRSA